MDEEGGRLRQGRLGVAAVTFFVISAAGPLTAVAGGIPLGMLLGNGAGTPAAYLVVVAILLLFSVGYTAMARHVRNAGAFYAFAARGLGGTAGAATAFVALVAYNGMQVGLYGLFGAACSGLFSSYGVELPWWAWSLAALAIVAVLGYRQIDLSAKVLSVLVILEYVSVLILDVAIVRKGGAAGLDLAPFTPGAFAAGSPSIALLFCFASFVGFEATTIYSEEARSPETTIPAATYVSVLLVGGFYALSTWAMVEGVGAGELMGVLQGLADPTRLIFTLSDAYVGSWLTLALGVLFVTSVFAGLLAFHNAAARYFFALGREGLLPAALGVAHARHGSPHLGSLTQSAFALGLLALFAALERDPLLELFAWLSNVGALGVLVLMAIAAFAVARFFRLRPQLAARPRLVVATALAAGLALAAVSALGAIRFDLLTGKAGVLSLALPGLIPLAAAAGVLTARRQRRRDPTRFALLGENR
jgi:amino acid transporter